MHVPATRERVRLKNKEGMFLVMWVDHDAQVADLAPIDSPELAMEEGIPFADLVPIIE